MASPSSPPLDPKTMRRALSLGDLPIDEPSRPERAVVTTRLLSEAQSPILGRKAAQSELCAAASASTGNVGEAGSTEQRTTELTAAAVTNVVQEIEAHADRLQNQNQTRRRVSLEDMTRYERVRHFLGRGDSASRYRKSLVDFLWNVSWGFVQVMSISSRTDLTEPILMRFRSSSLSSCLPFRLIWRVRRCWV